MKISISDLPLAAALQAMDFIPKLQNTSDGKFLFVYNKSPEIETAISDYWANRLKVNPKLHWSSVRELKSRMATYQYGSQGGING